MRKRGRPKRRGRPKGVELTIIGLVKCKRSKDDGQKLLPFSKLKRGEKSRIILECLTGKLAAVKCLSGKRLLSDDDVQSKKVFQRERLVSCS
jgi:hypothetical protein